IAGSPRCERGCANFLVPFLKNFICSQETTALTTINIRAIKADPAAGADKMERQPALEARDCALDLVQATAGVNGAITVGPFNVPCWISILVAFLMSSQRSFR